MAANASAHSNLITLHTHLHNLLLKLSLALHLSTPCPPRSHSNRLSQHLTSLSLSPTTKKPPPNPHDPLEVLYTLSPPAFHYLPRSTLLPPQILQQGFTETPENNPPFLSGHQMQIMVIPHGVRKIVIHFLVYDPIRLEEKQKHKRERSPNKGNRKISPFSSTSGSSGDSTSDAKIANGQAQTERQKQNQNQTSSNKLRRKISTNLHATSSKPRDQITNQRSTSRLSNRSAEPNIRLSMNGNQSMNGSQSMNGNRNRDLNLDLNPNIDEMEIEVLSKGTMTVMDREQREEDELGEYVVMKRVVRLPRRVWCGRNCKDKFEQLFIRRT